MSLDQNLFTLFLVPDPSHPTGDVVNLNDSSGKTHYRKRRIVTPQQPVYRIEVSDPLSEALLASASAPSATSKHKTLELYNPSNVVELKYIGTLTFRWSFKWETHEFEWKREECFIIRKPDPPVLVAVTKEPPGRIRTASVQILDYNLNRFDIEDRKGLEIVILTALLTFQDASDTYHEPSVNATPPASTATPVHHRTPASAPPSPPPKPAPKKGTERIAELQLGRGQVNEVAILEEGAVKDYAKHCVQLLQDEGMLFVSVRSSGPNQVPKVLQVIEETKRLRYKAGYPDLHQYVLYDTNEGTVPRKGPRIINLDDDDGKGKNKEYIPPKSLTVHLSKIDMPELRPLSTLVDRQRMTQHDQDGGKNKDKGPSKRVKGKDKDGRTNPIPTLPRRSTSPPHPRPLVVATLRKHRSQDFPSPSSGSVPSYHVPPPLPPRVPVPQHFAGTSRDWQALYGSLSAQDHHYYDHVQHGVAGNGASTSGLRGRFLGR